MSARRTSKVALRDIVDWLDATCVRAETLNESYTAKGEEPCRFRLDDVHYGRAAQRILQQIADNETAFRAVFSEIASKRKEAA